MHIPLSQPQIENRKLALQLAVSVANVSMQTEPGRVSRGQHSEPVSVTKLAKTFAEFMEGVEAA